MIRASGDADEQGKNHTFLYDETAEHWTLSPACDLTLNFSEDRDYHGWFPASFGPAPRLSAPTGIAAGAGVNRREFAQLDTEVAAALARWPEFTEAAGLPKPQRAQAASIHQGLATSLSTESPARRTKRPRSGSSQSSAQPRKAMVKIHPPANSLADLSR